MENVTPIEEPKKPTPLEIQQAYLDACAKIGDKQFQIEIKKVEIEKLQSELTPLKQTQWELNRTFLQTQAEATNEVKTN